MSPFPLRWMDCTCCMLAPHPAGKVLKIFSPVKLWRELSRHGSMLYLSWTGNCIYYISKSCDMTYWIFYFIIFFNVCSCAWNIYFLTMSVLMRSPNNTLMIHNRPQKLDHPDVTPARCGNRRNFVENSLFRWDIPNEMQHLRRNTTNRTIH